MFTFWRKKKPSLHRFTLPNGFELQGWAEPGEQFGSKLLETLRVWEASKPTCKSVGYTLEREHRGRRVAVLEVSLWSNDGEWSEAIRWLRDAIERMDLVPEDVAEFFATLKVDNPHRQG